MEQLVSDAVVELAILALVFTVIERLFRGARAPDWFKRPDLKTDLGFYFLNSLTSRGFEALMVVAVVTAIALLGGASLAELDRWFADDGADLAPEFMRDAVSSLPLPLQVLLGLAVADFIFYWGHRLFHAKPFWYLHAIHHSPPTLDWLSAVRSHPIDDAIMATLQTVPLLFLGFDPVVFVAVTPTIAVWSVFSHANVTWDFGPLKYLILTPRFHRWHHTSEEEGIDKNFAGLFPIYDLVFRTWYMPDSIPTEFGAGETPVPAGFWRQILYPFRQPKPGEVLARDVKIDAGSQFVKPGQA